MLSSFSEFWPCNVIGFDFCISPPSPLPEEDFFYNES